MGTAVVIDHPTANGLFDISITLDTLYLQTNGVDIDLGIKITDVSAINKGIKVLLKKGSRCDGSALSADDPDTYDITATSETCPKTTTKLSACAIHPAPTDGTTRSAEKLACLSVQRDKNNYQKASVAIEFYDTGGSNPNSRMPYTDTGSDGFKLTEDYKFDITGMGLTNLPGHKTSPGLTAGTITNGTATVAHDIKVRVGADGQDDYKFEDCSYISGTAPDLNIAFTGEKQSFIDDAVTNGHGNGYASNYLSSHNYVASPASNATVHNADDQTCDLHFRGNHVLQFPIDDMLTSYWKSTDSDCGSTTVCNGKADITFGTNSADVWAGAAVKWSTHTMSVQEIDAVTKISDPTSRFTNYKSDIKMAGNLFGVTYQTNSAATLETVVTFEAPVDPDSGIPGAVTGCYTPQTQLKLYQIPKGDLGSYIEGQVDSCLVTYPVDYNVNYKIKFGGEESNEYRMNATDIGADAEFTLQFSGQSTLASVDDVFFDYADTITGRGFSADQAQIVSCAAATIVPDPTDTPAMGSLATSCFTGNSATASHKTSIPVYRASDAFVLSEAKSHQTKSGSNFGNMLCDPVTLQATVVARVQDIAGELTDVPLTARATFMQPADAHDDSDASLSVPAWDTAGYNTDTVFHAADRTVHDAVTVVYTPDPGVTITSDPLQLSAASVGAGGLQYNCDADGSDQVITYSFAAQLPCKTGTTTVSKTTEYKVKYDRNTQATPTVVPGSSQLMATATEKAHHDFRKDDAGYLQATIKYTSTAIKNDGNVRHLSCDGSDDDHPCSMTYKDNDTPLDSSDDYVLFTVEFKKQIDNGPTVDYVSKGADSQAIITYTFNERCGGPENVTTNFSPTFTITRVADKYRGRIDVSDYLNTGLGTKETSNSSYAEHLDDLTIDFGLQLGLGVYNNITNPHGVKNPSVYKVDFYKEQHEAENKQSQSFKVSWNNSKVKWVPYAGADPHPVAHEAPVTIGSGGESSTLYFQPVKAANASVARGASAGSFDVTITSGSVSAFASRKVTINIINLEPPARLKVQKDDGNTYKFAETGETKTLCEDYSCYMNDNNNNKDSLGFKRVSFLMNIDTVSSGSVSQRSVIASGKFIKPRTITVDSNKKRQNFEVNSTNCKHYGEITLKLVNYVGETSVGNDITSTIRFPCRRTADAITFRDTTKLDYTINFTASLTDQSLKFGDQFDGVTRDITTSGLTNDPLTCATGGSTGGKAICTDTTVVTDAAAINSLRSMSDFFSQCGSWDTTNAIKDVGDMVVVRKFTGTQSNNDPQHYCQLNTLKWTVFKTGHSKQTIVVQGFGGARFRFDLDKLEYTKCNAGHKYAFEISGEVSTDGGSNWSESGLKLQDVTFSGEPVQLKDSGVDDHLVTAGTTTEECSDYCHLKAHSTPVTVSFTATYQLPTTLQTIHADVTATLQMSGDPCSLEYKPEISANDMKSVAEPSLLFAVVQQTGNCKEYTGQWSSSVTPTITQKLCAKIVSAASGLYPATLTGFSFVDGAGNPLTSVGNTNNKADDFWLDQLQANAQIEVTAYWTIDINSGTAGNGRRMLRTTYTLGSNHGESHASIRVLPAGVQIQEQIEAAPAHDVIYNGTVLNTTEDPLPDHEHHKANIGLGLGIGGVVGVVGLGLGVWIFTMCKRKDGYEPVGQGRFEANLAF